MDIIIPVIIVILIIIITFLLLFFSPKPKCYYEINEINKSLNIFTDKNEMEKLRNHFNNYPSDEIYNIDDNNIFSDMIDIDITDIKIINLNTKISTDKYYKTDKLLCIIPISMSNIRKSGIWVDGETKFFKLDNILICDIKKEYRIFSKNKRAKTKILTFLIDRIKDK